MAVPADLRDALTDRYALERELGRGGMAVVARLAAEQVGSVGAVAGLDPNPGMLAVAGAVTPSNLGIEWHQAGAESMPLPEPPSRLAPAP